MLDVGKDDLQGDKNMINKNNFKNPASIYRSAPFWALNDELQPQELKRQINVFKKQGIGGTFLHPRGGMSTEYLSDDYFNAIRVCIEELDKLDMIAWLYDEDRFPSGFAGGKIVKNNPDFAQKCIVPSIVDATEVLVAEDTLAIFLIKDDKYEPVSLDSIPTEGKILSIALVQTYKQPRFDGESYVDVCSKEAIDEFINITHEKYYQNFKEYFGTTIPAIFTDEPNFNTNIPGAIPWTKDFEIKFKVKFGYDLLMKLPDLFLNTENCQKTRYNYWDLISSLFVEAFSKNVYDWCEKKGIAYTGHFWEHVFPSPRHTGSVMPHYEYMQYPGIDMLFVANEETPEMYGNDFNVKEVSSVANQLGKERVISETHGASGWGLDFRYQKRATDWQLVLGINLFSQHLSLYSMTGYRKRDFPQSFLDHQPWWDEYKMLGDYMGRLSYALSQGQYQADVLVLHPSSSTWTAFGALEENEQAIEISTSIKNVVKNLNQLQIMFDLGDDIIISKHGKIIDGQFVVGKMKYKVVILPQMDVIRADVFELLRAFRQNNGIIIASGKTPTLLEGVYSNELVTFFNDHKIIKLENEKNTLSAFLYSMSVERVVLQEANQKDISNVYGHIRKEGDSKTVFVCNLDMEQRVELLLKLEKPFSTIQFNAENGETSDCEVFLNNEGEYYIKFTLDALNSALFLMDESQLIYPGKEENKSNIEKVLDLSDWSVKTLDYNAINIQFCRASLDNEPYGEIDDVLRIDDSFKDRLGIERGHIFMRQPWMYSDEEKKDLHFVKAEYPFVVETMPKGSLMAAVELPDKFSVFINDIKVSPKDEYYKDRVFVLYDIAAYVKTGANVIRIESNQYGVLINLESIYILGDFKLSTTENGFAICDANALSPGNLVKQGYPYYSGKIEYRTEVNIDSDFDDAILCFDNFFGVTATVKVNDKKVCSLGWKPYCVNLTSYLKKGSNTLVIEIANSLQNLMGPFDIKANLNLAEPGSFYTSKHEKFSPVGFQGVAEIHLMTKMCR